MAKAFSVASWNVEHFGATDKKKKKIKKPAGPIIDLLAKQNADVVAVYEVVGSTIFTEVSKKMSGYTFHITEGPQSQEILVGVRKSFTAFFTQRLEFRSGVSMLRPGALLTLTRDNVNYSLLFLHLKSLPRPRGFGLRDDQTERALKFRKTLDKAANGKANYLFLGDLNTMGLNLTFSKKDLSGAEEIQRLKDRCKSKKMVVLGKNEAATWWPGSGSSLSPSDLDHVVAADHLKFKTFGGDPVKVVGWPQESTAAKKDTWAKKFSDHALLFFEVQKV